jgi:hypothetical protein
MAAEPWVGAEEAERLVSGRPRAVVEDRPPVDIRPPPGLGPNAVRLPQVRPRKGWLGRLLSGG